MKKLILITTILVFGFIVSANTVYAGSPQQYRWEGAAIGVGAAILGSILFHNVTHAPVVKPPARPHHSGHWENRPVWVPGHFNYGTWVPGGWQGNQVWVTR